MGLFFAILNMSITASIVAVILIIVRYIFQKCKIPKRFYYVMWSVLIFRLTIPFSFTSIFSLFNLSSEKGNTIIQVKENIAQIEFIEGISTIKNVIHSNNVFSIILKICAIFWAVIAFVLILTFVISFAIAKFKLQTAFIIHNNHTLEKCKEKLNVKRDIKLFKSSKIDSAILFGVINPKIIISDKLDLNNEATLKHILTHELVHIKRLDYILKLIARITLIIHWFNPIIWLCYLLFEKDMEVSCDELAVGIIGIENKNDYANSIINMASVQHNFAYANILGFGELTIKSRVKNIAKYEKISKIKNILAIVFILFIGVITASNPVVHAEHYYYPNAINISEHIQNQLITQTQLLINILENKDSNALAKLSNIDNSTASLQLNPLMEYDYTFVKYKIYPQSEKLSHTYIYFKNDICLVGIFERNDSETFILKKLYDISTFEKSQIVKRDNFNDDAVLLIKNLHKFGIIDPSNNIEKISKPAITGFCIEDARTDLIKQGKLLPDDIYIESKYIEQDAKRYFDIDNFSYTFDEELFDNKKQMYIYDKNRGGNTRADIINIEQKESRTIITAQTYKDSLHTTVDKTVIYTLYKDR